MTGWLAALFGALPALLQGVAAFQTKRAALMMITPSTHAQTQAEDDAELARRAAQEAPTAPVRRTLPTIESAGDSAPGVAVDATVPAKSNPY